MSNVIMKVLKNGQIAIKGQVQYASVHEPNRKFDPEGIYSVDIMLDEEDKEVVEKVLMPIVEKGFNDVCEKDPKMKKLGTTVSPVTELYDDEGEVTGYRLRVKQPRKVTAKTGKEMIFSVKVTDGLGKPIPKSILIGNGSTCVVLFDPNPYWTAKDKCAGVTLRLKEVRVLELVEYGKSSAIDELGDEFTSDFDASTVAPSATIPEEDTPFEADEDDEELY